MDNMLPIELASPTEICRMLAGRMKAARLAADLTQEALAERAGVSYGTLKRFESKGAASLEVVVRLAFALRLEGGFEGLFAMPKFTSMDEVVSASTVRHRRRGRGR